MRKVGVNWKEVWVGGRTLCEWSGNVRGKLALVRMDNSTAAAYTNHGAARSSELTVIARGIKEPETANPCTLVELRAAGV